MTGDLWQKFGERFLGSARARVARARPAIESSSREAVMSIANDMHALAGEASMIGVAKVAHAAKALEAAVKRWNAAQTKDDIEREVSACTQRLRELTEMLQTLEVTKSDSTPPR